MDRFARLIETEQGQVLATIEEDDEGKSFLQIRMQRPGFMVTHKLNYATRKRCVEEMETLNEEKARGLHEAIDAMVK
jgi:hypothetical protein